MPIVCNPLNVLHAKVLMRKYWICLSSASAVSVIVGCGGEPFAEPSEDVSAAQEPLSVAAVLDVGSYYGCVALTDGTVYCWGTNASSGQLGDGTLTNRSSPVQATGLSNIVDVSAYSMHTCAVDSSGAAYCWGSNGYGKLGDGTFTNHYTAAAVTGVSTAIGVSVGSEHSCAVLSSGSVKCWGQNLYGQLGIGFTSSYSLSPVTVLNLSNTVALASGAYYSCALDSSGGVRCWGQNGNGQLGDGTITDKSGPVSVSGISTAVAITAMSNHACALLSGGTIKCWGTNTYGELGTGSTTPVYSSTPVTVLGISNAIAISAGVGHTCAVHTGGSVSCWGNNGLRQLGDGTTTNSASPVSVSGLSNAVAVSGGQTMTCASISGGGVKCWGTESEGQLGDGGSLISHTTSSPVAVSLP